ncbi:YqzE family protein [Bacillus canaveralius]|uniref:YqzE family protein n=1 Tax=Bacillus canaveralius TaxID=1403243 RepID=A0A2N5GRB9_9BACI|nr:MULTISPECIES: YqzE family protein [Bacillus]PLR85970.1 YqzE family protein [Bacillus canaveralius]PLR87568.1 YqzE family protein [Bacillus sp. V33-4]PLS00089.1 YqzE family protein [Bacillus canaveralius]RSK53407.1 YqzE family protein [Bacillus canaveralius]
MKTNDYVKYITQNVVKYIDQPKDVRKKIKDERKETKQPFLIRWFGILPYLFQLGKNNRKHEARSRK